MTDRVPLERPGLVIFDCDGVLVDTEPVTLRVLTEWICSLGLKITVEEVTTRFKGRDISLIKAEVEEQIGREVPEFVEGYRSNMFQAFEVGIAPIEGAVATLDALDAAGIPWCVASNGPRSKMKVSLSSAGLLERVGGLEVTADARVFSAYDIEKWKPEPDLFLYAAEKMGVSPDRSVVVEDSTSGVEAATRAGMRCVAYADITPAAELAGATVVVGSMGDVAGVLGLM
jgi:HAD superfamily hydrolase (TIGR01509 family)